MYCATNLFLSFQISIVAEDKIIYTVCFNFCLKIF